VHSVGDPSFGLSNSISNSAMAAASIFFAVIAATACRARNLREWTHLHWTVVSASTTMHGIQKHLRRFLKLIPADKLQQAAKPACCVPVWFLAMGNSARHPQSDGGGSSLIAPGFHHLGINIYPWQADGRKGVRHGSGNQARGKGVLSHAGETGRAAGSR